MFNKWLESRDFTCDILPLYDFLQFVLRDLVLIMGSPGCIKTVKYVFYVNVRRLLDKLVLIKFVVNNLRNCRKQPTKKINHRNINTENCPKCSQNYMLIFCENVKNNMTFIFYFLTILQRFISFLATLPLAIILQIALHLVD